MKADVCIIASLVIFHCVTVALAPLPEVEN